MREAGTAALRRALHGESGSLVERLQVCEDQVQKLQHRINLRILRERERAENVCMREKEKARELEEKIEWYETYIYIWFSMNMFTICSCSDQSVTQLHLWPLSQRAVHQRTALNLSWRSQGRIFQGTLCLVSPVCTYAPLPTLLSQVSFCANLRCCPLWERLICGDTASFSTLCGSVLRISVLMQTTVKTAGRHENRAGKKKCSGNILYFFFF